jgi:hypothetical protein
MSTRGKLLAARKKKTIFVQSVEARPLDIIIIINGLVSN